MLLDINIIQWIIFGLIFWTIVLTSLLVQTILHYRRLTKNINKKDLKTVLSNLLSQISSNNKRLDTLETDLKDFRVSSKSYIQKIGFVRFNPFPQTGGDQSFCLSLLDENNNGFVISSLHSRDLTRLYAKTIKGGKAEGYQLSKEEKKAIKNAK